MALTKRLFAVLMLCALLAGAASIAPPDAQAQEGVALKVLVPDFMISAFPEEMFDAFTEQTGVTVLLELGDYPFFPYAATAGLDAHLTAAEEYVGQADVLLVLPVLMSAEMTRAGYFLDLAPLVASDPTFNPDDFFPAAWQSVQWDQGIWAIPTSFDIDTLNYLPERFDEAGLNYPTERWTIDDFDFAVRALTQYKADGTVEAPGMLTISNDTLLFRALLGADWYDDNAFPILPDFSDPALEHILTVWDAMQADQVNTFSEMVTDTDQVPMRIEQSYGLRDMPGDETQAAGAYLPGGIVGIQTMGFAVSSGTLYPQPAYELAKYLSTQTQINNFFAMMPARQSLAGAEPEEDSVFAFMPFPPESEAFVNEAIWHALPSSEVLFGDYLRLAMQKMRSDGLDARTALDEAQALAIANLEEAAARRASTAVMVATPIPTPALATGEIALTFGMLSYTMASARETLQSVADRFVAEDPEVAQIVFNITGNSIEEFVEQADCFYIGYNPLESGTESNLGILNIDPFLDADPTFDRNDVLPGALLQVQRDNKTWGLPFAIQPEVLRYDAAAFEAAGVPLPEDGWTIDAFIDALHRLKPTPDDPAPLAASSDGRPILMLIAAHGGLPIDYRTDPATIDFTSPEVVDAIRQTLDLARNGYIDYQMLNFINNTYSGGISNPAITPTVLNPFMMFSDAPDESYRLVPFPTGSQFAPVAFRVEVGLISADTPHPEACYRLLSFVAAHPELLNEMPARRSLFDDPALLAQQGETAVEFYRSYDQLLQGPNVVIFRNTTIGDYLEQNWLFAAFDAYVLEDANLEEALTDAETLVKTFRACVAAVTPYDPAAYESEDDYYQQLLDCARNIDPELDKYIGQFDEE
ncbi:MAG: hypothetical protein JXB47_02905 [Anaerolineae bacterium]|nr:hypothetical protein [Anaerolineae bacterium]